MPAKIGRPPVCNPGAFQTRKSRGGGTSSNKGGRGRGGRNVVTGVDKAFVDINVERGDSFELFEVVELEVEPLVDEETEADKVDTRETQEESYVDITRGEDKVEKEVITEADSYASKFVKGKLGKIFEQVEEGKRAAEEDYHVFCQGYNAPKRRKSERIANIQKTIVTKDGVGLSEDKPFVIE